MELPGRAIAPGIACGRVVRNRPDLTAQEADGAILVAEHAVPDDVPKIVACAGTITGMALPLSHVGLLCLDYGKPSVALADLSAIAEGALVLVDGNRGAVVLDPEHVPAPSRPARRKAHAPLVSRPVDGPIVLPLAPGLDVDTAGGKAAALAEVSAILPAWCRGPAGFVVTTAAYRSHLEGETGRKLEKACRETDDAALSRLARAAILGGAISTEIRRAIEKAAEALGRVPFAVRSSATIEDGAFGSMAGLFDSVLGVRAPDLADRVRSIWASLWNARAVAALRAAGTTPIGAHQAVLVQEALATRAAGVLATGDPVVVNAAWGLGEGVAQGEIPGDHFVLRRDTGAVLAAEPGHASTRIVLDPDRAGTVERPLPDELRGRPSIAPEQLELLHRLARTLPDRIVEFGFDDSGTLVVFQVRRMRRGG